MPNIRLVLEYDGTDFHGWQKQPGLRTVQGTVESAVLSISREKIQLVGSGRTDAGVHARAQVANFSTRARHSPATWRAALNAHLPPDVAVIEADRVPEAFHARRSAVARVYEYRILQRETPSPLQRRFAWLLKGSLDLRPMRRTAVLLRGRHDFTSFAAAGAETEDRTIDLRRAEILREGSGLLFTFEADRFLWHLVRNLVGFLVATGQGKISPRRALAVLAARDRRQAGPIAPAQGLCLANVRYPEL